MSEDGRAPVASRSRVGARRLAAGAALAGGIALGLWAWSHGEAVLDPAALRARIQALGWLAPAAFVAAAALRPFLAAPSWAVMSAGGLLFGVAGGMLWGLIGFTAGAFMTFGIARGLGRDALEGRLRGRLARADAWMAERGAAWLGAYTALPVVPLTPGHAAAGLSSMRLPAFTGAVIAGLLPRTAVFSAFGDAFARGDLEHIAAISAFIAFGAVLGIWATRRFGPPRDP
jgi:uncharacterized membrane protein YdjX (TVP38/TMEM64 family)